MLVRVMSGDWEPIEEPSAMQKTAMKRIKAKREQFRQREA